jgi:hypothetical protein
MTAWITEMNNAETEAKFYEYCLDKYVELNTIFTEQHSQGLLKNYEYKLCIIWAKKSDYSIRKEYQWKY